MIQVPQSFFAGPLEGAIAPEVVIPDEFLTRLKQETENGKVDVASFAGLVNLSFAYRIDAEHAAMAAKALEIAGYQLSRTASDDDVSALLLGLASVSAMTRSIDLANKVRLLSGVTRRSRQARSLFLDEFRTSMIASAAHQDKGGWAKFIGGWLTTISSEIAPTEAGWLPRARDGDP